MSHDTRSRKMRKHRGDLDGFSPQQHAAREHNEPSGHHHHHRNDAIASSGTGNKHFDVSGYFPRDIYSPGMGMAAQHGEGRNLGTSLGLSREGSLGAVHPPRSNDRHDAVGGAPSSHRPGQNAPASSDVKMGATLKYVRQLETQLEMLEQDSQSWRTLLVANGAATEIRFFHASEAQQRCALERRWAVELLQLVGRAFRARLSNRTVGFDTSGVFRGGLSSAATSPEKGTAGGSLLVGGSATNADLVAVKDMVQKMLHASGSTTTQLSTVVKTVSAFEFHAARDKVAIADQLHQLQQRVDSIAEHSRQASATQREILDTTKMRGPSQSSGPVAATQPSLGPSLEGKLESLSSEVSQRSAKAVELAVNNSQNKIVAAVADRIEAVVREQQGATSARIAQQVDALVTRRVTEAVQEIKQGMKSVVNDAAATKQHREPSTIKLSMSTQTTGVRTMDVGENTMIPVNYADGATQTERVAAVAPSASPTTPQTAAPTVQQTRAPPPTTKALLPVQHQPTIAGERVQSDILGNIVGFVASTSTDTGGGVNNYARGGYPPVLPDNLGAAEDSTPAAGSMASNVGSLTDNDSDDSSDLLNSSEDESDYYNNAQANDSNPNKPSATASKTAAPVAYSAARIVPTTVESKQSSATIGGITTTQAKALAFDPSKLLAFKKAVPASVAPKTNVPECQKPPESGQQSAQQGTAAPVQSGVTSRDRIGAVSPTRHPIPTSDHQSLSTDSAPSPAPIATLTGPSTPAAEVLPQPTAADTAAEPPAPVATVMSKQSSQPPTSTAAPGGRVMSAVKPLPVPTSKPSPASSAVTPTASGAPRTKHSFDDDDDNAAPNKLTTANVTTLGHSRGTSPDSLSSSTDDTTTMGSTAPNSPAPKSKKLGKLDKLLGSI